LIRAYRFHSWQLFQAPVGHHTAFSGVGAVRGMDVNIPDDAFGIGRYLTAPAFDLLSTMKATLFAFAKSFDRLGIDQQVTGGWVAAFFFESFRSSSSRFSARLHALPCGGNGCKRSAISENGSATCATDNLFC
jgi:hypothetical protein